MAARTGIPLLHFNTLTKAGKKERKVLAFRRAYDLALVFLRNVVPPLPFNERVWMRPQKRTRLDLTGIVANGPLDNIVSPSLLWFCPRVWTEDECSNLLAAWIAEWCLFWVQVLAFCLSGSRFPSMPLSPPSRARWARFSLPLSSSPVALSFLFSSQVRSAIAETNSEINLVHVHSGWFKKI